MTEESNSCCSNFLRNIFRKKNVSEDMMRRDLRRCFNLGDLTFLAISGMMGSGLYVLAGTVTRNITGPSIVISYVVAAFASILSALCYAEFAARIPVAGSAYQFTYLSVGEFWAFIVGWNVALEHTIYVAAIAKTCSGYLDGLFGMAISKYMKEHAPMPGGFVATYPDFLSAGLILIFALVLIGGVKLSSKVNIAIATLNVAVITFIIVTGFILADWDNWFNVKGGFFPYGWSGTISGSTTLVYSYVGYEVVASATEEAVNAGKDIPLSLLVSIIVVVIAYVGASASLTLISPWYLVSVVTPYPTAYAYRGWYWARYVVSIGALAAMLTCLLSILFVVPRYLLAMARDGLLWKFFTILHPKTQVPYVSTLIVAAISMLMSIIFSLTTLVEFIAVGQLLACTFVGICVIRLRYSPNDISTYKRADQCDDDPNELKKVSTEPSGDKDGASLSSKGDTNSTTSTVNEKSALCKTHQTTEAGCSSSESGGSTSYDAITTDETTGLMSSANYGTLKKTVINSSYGFLFAWAQKYEAGNVPLYSLLLAIFCSTIASIMLLFASAAIGNWWFILILVVLILTSFCSITLITFFVQDDSIKTFKVPFVPFLPYLSIIINILLMLKLKPLTWIRFGVWMVFGLIIYFAYGYRNSKARVKDD